MSDELQHLVIEDVPDHFRVSAVIFAGPGPFEGGRMFMVRDVESGLDGYGHTIDHALTNLAERRDGARDAPGYPTVTPRP